MHHNFFGVCHFLAPFIRPEIAVPLPRVLLQRGDGAPPVDPLRRRGGAAPRQPVQNDRAAAEPGVRGVRQVHDPAGSGGGEVVGVGDGQT